MVTMRVGINQMNDTEKEKIVLGIKSITDYEQELVNSKPVSGIQEVEMTLDEWKQLVITLPNTNHTIYIRGSRLLGIGNDPMIIKESGKVLLRADEGIDATKIKHILSVLTDCKYEFYREPEKAQQPEAQQPEKTPEERRKEDLIQRQHKAILACIKAIKLSQELNLSNQVELHNAKLQYHQARLEHIEDKIHDADDRENYEVRAPDELGTLIPLEALQILKEQQQNFDSLEVWLAKSDDPLLIGVIENSYSVLYVELASWEV